MKYCLNKLFDWFELLNGVNICELSNLRNMPFIFYAFNIYNIITLNRNRMKYLPILIQCKPLLPPRGKSIFNTSVSRFLIGFVIL